MLTKTLKKIWYLILASFSVLRNAELIGISGPYNHTFKTSEWDYVTTLAKISSRTSQLTSLDWKQVTSCVRAGPGSASLGLAPSRQGEFTRAAYEPAHSLPLQNTRLFSFVSVS